ncbi:hypothetical protein Tco_0067539 [Tanacetum coccineum]
MSLCASFHILRVRPFGFKPMRALLDVYLCQPGRKIEELDQDPDVTLFDTTRVKDLREESAQEEGSSGEMIIEECFRIFSVVGVLAEKGLTTAGTTIYTADTLISTAQLTTVATKVSAITNTRAALRKGVMIQEPVIQRVTVSIP